MLFRSPRPYTDVAPEQWWYEGLTGEVKTRPCTDVAHRQFWHEGCFTKQPLTLPVTWEFKTSHLATDARDFPEFL